MQQPFANRWGCYSRIDHLIGIRLNNILKITM